MENEGLTEKVRQAKGDGVQSALPTQIRATLTDSEKEFILKFKKSAPDWQVFPIGHVKDLPAIQWKLQNIKKMTKKKLQEACDKLRVILEHYDLYPIDPLHAPSCTAQAKECLPAIEIVTNFASSASSYIQS